MQHSGQRSVDEWVSEYLSEIMIVMNAGYL